MPSPPIQNLATLRGQLVEKLRSLRETSAQTADDRKPVELDQSSVGRLSRMESMQMQQMAMAAERRRDIDIARTEAAIRRIDQGDYGFCAVCDEPIAEGRLKADPAVPTCLSCAAKQG